MNKTTASTSKVKVKTERLTKEDATRMEWIKKFLSKPVPAAPISPGFGYILCPETDEVISVVHSGFDITSALGTFTWENLPGDKNVPCLWRNDEKFVAVRMAEISVLSRELNLIPSKFYSSAKLDSHYVTPAEYKLLKYINSFHCGEFYDPEPFTTFDIVVSLKNLEIFYDFLSFALNCLHSGGQNPDSGYKKCGFVRINTETMIPYAVMDSDEKVLPLFYFNGDTEILKPKAKTLTGWPLAFLKVCCKIQSVRWDLISGPTLQVVTLSDLKAYFPRRTKFTEKCWPPPKPKTFLDKQAIEAEINSPLCRVTRDKWTKIVPNETAFSNYIVPDKPNADAVPVGVDNIKNGVANLTLNGTPKSFQIPECLRTKSPALAKIKLRWPPRDKSKLVPIAEISEGENDGAYVVKLIIVENELMHCINANVGISDEYLIPLQEFMSKFFLSALIYPRVVNEMDSLDIFTYLPNSAQMKALNDFGFEIKHNWEIPLIPAKGVAQKMTKLKKIFRQRPTTSATAGSSGSVPNCSMAKLNVKAEVKICRMK